MIATLEFTDSMIVNKSKKNKNLLNLTDIAFNIVYILQ